MIDNKITEIQDRGYGILREHFARPLIDACRDAFWPVLLTYLENHGHEPNRGPHRHFLPMPFEPPCFVPAFFFDHQVLSIVRSVTDDRAVADQWGCDVPLRGSEYQRVHVDYQRPLFDEAPDLSLPAYMLVVNFGLVRISLENGPLEIAPGTHRMPRKEALRDDAISRGRPIATFRVCCRVRTLRPISPRAMRPGQLGDHRIRQRNGCSSKTFVTTFASPCGGWLSALALPP
jgi:hypothetical protein